MEGLYFSAPVDDERTLCLAPMTDRRLSMASQDVPDTSGYFLYELIGTGETARVEIIARVISDEAIHRLREMIRLD